MAGVYADRQKLTGQFVLKNSIIKQGSLSTAGLEEDGPLQPWSNLIKVEDR